jgi:hypothetical protein
MQAKSDELVRKNKSLRNKNKGTVLSCRVPIGDVLQWYNPALLIAELETRVEQLRASEVDMKNLFYWEKEALRYLNMIISSWLTSAISTWSFELARIVTSSTATNPCKS